MPIPTATPSPISRFIEPTQPPNLYYVPDEYQPGVYLIGHDKFLLSNTTHIARYMHRNLSNADEFILGILSVLLIAILSEIVHTILLRTSSKRSQVPSDRLQSAFLFSEVSHLRHLCLHLYGVCWPAAYGGAPTQRLSVRGVLVSLSVVVAAVVVFSVDVLVVMLTQPGDQFSTAAEYNLRGEHPVTTNSALSAYIARMAGDRPCVSPFMANGTHTRHFQLQTCMHLDTSKDQQEDGTAASNVTIESFFHATGADHNISFPPAWISLRVRVDLLLADSAGGDRHLIFQSIDTASFAHARYMQAMIVHIAKRRVCRKNESTPVCSAMDARTAPHRWYPRKRRIELRPGRGEDVVGVVSEFRDVKLSKPYESLRVGSKMVLPGGVVREVAGAGRYVPFSNSSVEEDGIAGLVAEQRRAASVVVLLAVVFCCVCCLGVLRIWLRPASLGGLALHKAEMAVSDRFEGAARQASCGCVGARGEQMPPLQERGTWQARIETNLTL